MIVAIESASSDPSLALAAAGGTIVAETSWSGTIGQGRELMPRLLELLEGAQRRIAEATAVAVGIGPGSFTGLRVGMGLAKGIAFGLGVPIVGVPSLDAWLEADPGARAAVARAGAHEGFVLVRGAPEPIVAGVAEMPPGLRDAAVVAPAELAAAFELLNARPPAHAAAAIARLAAADLARRPSGDDLRRLEPAYLRLPRGLERLPAEAIRWL